MIVFFSSTTNVGGSSLYTDTTIKITKLWHPALEWDTKALPNAMDQCRHRQTSQGGGFHPVLEIFGTQKHDFRASFVPNIQKSIPKKGYFSLENCNGFYCSEDDSWNSIEISTIKIMAKLLVTLFFIRLYALKNIFNKSIE